MNSQKLYSARSSTTLASITQNTDARWKAADIGTATIGAGSATRRVRCDTAGNLAVTYENGDTDILPFTAGESQDICILSVQLAGTSVTGKVTFYY